jgi:hypothetical protein
MLSFRDTELRSSAGSLTHVSHSGRQTPDAGRPGAGWPRTRRSTAPMIAVSTTNACSSAAGSPSRRSAPAAAAWLPATGGVVAARARRLADPPPPARRVCHGLALAALTLAIAAFAFLPAFAVTVI